MKKLIFALMLLLVGCDKKNSSPEFTGPLTPGFYLVDVKVTSQSGASDPSIAEYTGISITVHQVNAISFSYFGVGVDENNVNDGSRADFLTVWVDSTYSGSVSDTGGVVEAERIVSTVANRGVNKQHDVYEITNVVPDTRGEENAISSEVKRERLSIINPDYRFLEEMGYVPRGFFQ